MGYTTSKRAIRRVEPYLQQMLAADGVVEFPSDDAARFAYALREGIQVSKKFAIDPSTRQPVEPYASYQSLNARFIIRVKNNTVVCEPRDVVAVLATRREISVAIPDVTDTLGIIGAVVMHHAPVMVFPDANEASVDENRLRAWATEKGYEVTVADNHVTLARNDSQRGSPI